MPPSRTHLVVIPSYNSGELLARTVAEARTAWSPVWVVIDGSTDHSADALPAIAADPQGFRVLRHDRNRGKGAAVLTAIQSAAAEGFSHALVMDADGQHPAGSIADFMAASMEQPEAMVLGVPQFGVEAPRLRVGGRRISNWWVDLETLWAGIGDSLFGFRVYPIAPLRRIMRRNLAMRRFDFEPEAAVRLSWAGVPALNIPAPVRYLTAAEGGVSHFRYGRDNLLLTGMHIRLMFGFLWRSPWLAWRRLRPARGPAPAARR